MVVVLAAGLFAAVFGMRVAVANPAEGIGFLYVVPVALLAVEFGRWAGVAAAAVALGLVTLWDLTEDVEVGVDGYLARGIALVVMGALVGQLAMRRRRLEEETSRWFEMSNALLAVVSLDGYFTRLNAAWQSTLGFSREELMSRPYVDFLHPDDLERTSRAAAGLGESASALIDVETRFRTRDGNWRWLLWSARSDGHAIYAVAKDVTDRKQLEAERDALLARVEAIAHTDELTGLPNRRAWEEELRREVARAARHGHPLCVVMLDLDRFKDYNDTHGHPAGDALLRDVAVAWRTAIRVTDFIARHGGEEFAALLSEVRPDEAASSIVERLREAVPAGQTCSAGVALWDGAESPEAALARADAALYDAKRAGRNRISIAQ
jgi:diguanylate cyclase (GGDEF)-like protein/PAS domain S-box-containing protein